MSDTPSTQAAVKTTPTTDTRAAVYLDTNRVISAISPLVFGGFAEHMGRCVYGGLYDPGSPQADQRGFRRDVLSALRELNYSIIRYPGGNFLSGYHWQDGVGPREQRPHRRDLAWHSIETNAFGTNEFMDYCRELNTLPMLGVNLGTGTIDNAANLVEYCNSDAGSYYADLRVQHGYPTPHGVKYWCLGNEMDGPWQIGHLEAYEYGRKATEAAKLMRWLDHDLQLILCGSSNTNMPTYPEWDRVALEQAWHMVDYHSMHYYTNNASNDTSSYLASSAQFENHVDTLSGVLRYVKAKLRSKHDVYLSWDEWNTWYFSGLDRKDWVEAPPMSEEDYNLEDALVVAQWLSVFLRRADVVKMACVAQIVNTISPLATTRDGLLKRTIYYPFLLFRQLAIGQALDVEVRAPHYTTTQFGDMPLIDVSASYDEATDQGAVFIVNRSQTETLTVDLCWQDRVPQRFGTVYQLAGTDPKATNTFDHPNTIVPVQVAAPVINDKTATLALPPLSFTALSTHFQRRQR